ncbi:uncharacterized protein PAN0_017d5504 [Moesziomyces antarcticus]|uniref:Uncharacterized protein n=2 Tax=Pseudozyma antarctica TaxID=84753 RepID=A0A5C3FWX5_PSEA2|nr:uncharacterized protein PAN0_017d5504 [Moesziomyces antarcticus]GAK67277.1 conserved hypothetical protein [Moesziomyces antarcticus]SPO48111.1 uncharacterized protein PSANT_05799 [Moesziomyces antarcticus]
MPLQGWDALRILTQITALQSIHYLVLAAVIPALLAVFADTASLMFEGGPTQVGMLFDWRQLAAYPTYDWNPPKRESWDWNETLVDDPVMDQAVFAQWNLDNVWINSTNMLDHDNIIRVKGSTVVEPSGEGGSVEERVEHWEWSHTKDSARSWTLMLTWIASIPLDTILLVYLVRRPTHILDHTATFHLVNLVITSLYTESIPTSLTWYAVMLAHAAATVVLTEHAAIKRELNRSVGYNLVGAGHEEHAQMVWDARQDIPLKPL